MSDSAHSKQALQREIIEHQRTKSDVEQEIADVLVLNMRRNIQDWVCEACDVIYPLFDAILQYTIETLVLDANILRDSILVRLEMVIKHVLLLYCTATPSPSPFLSLNLRCSSRLSYT